MDQIVIIKGNTSSKCVSTSCVQAFKSSLFVSSRCLFISKYHLSTQETVSILRCSRLLDSKNCLILFPLLIWLHLQREQKFPERLRQQVCLMDTRLDTTSQNPTEDVLLTKHMSLPRNRHPFDSADILEGLVLSLLSFLLRSVHLSSRRNKRPFLFQQDCETCLQSYWERKKTTGWNKQIVILPNVSSFGRKKVGSFLAVVHGLFVIWHSRVGKTCTHLGNCNLSQVNECFASL